MTPSPDVRDDAQPGQVVTTQVDVVRAWKDPAYRATLPQAVRDQLPAAPDDVDELTAEELERAAGGILTISRHAAAALLTGGIVAGAGSGAYLTEALTNPVMKPPTDSSGNLA